MNTVNAMRWSGGTGGLIQQGSSYDPEKKNVLSSLGFQAVQNEMEVFERRC